MLKMTKLFSPKVFIGSHDFALKISCVHLGLFAGLLAVGYLVFLRSYKTEDNVVERKELTDDSTEKENAARARVLACVARFGPPSVMFTVAADDARSGSYVLS